MRVSKILSFCMLFGLIVNICAENLSVQEHRNWPRDTEEVCGISYDADRIVGGSNAGLGQFPWQARIGYMTKSASLQLAQRPNDKIFAVKHEAFNCGGTLISRRHVLTAAHCLQLSSIEISSVQLGELITNTDLDCDDYECSDHVQVFKPVEIHYSDSYSGPPKYKDDIGTIKLDRDAIITDWVRPICLPYGKIMSKNHIGRRATVCKSPKYTIFVDGHSPIYIIPWVSSAGWGLTNSSTRHVPSILQHVSIPIVPMNSCEDFFEGCDLDETQICAGGEKGVDSCDGDSGGPLQIVENTIYGPRYFLIGLVSYGTRNCGIDVPAVYTRVTSHMKQILNQLY